MSPITDAAFADLVASDDHFNMPSNWSIDFDHVHDRLIVTEHPAELIDRQRAVIRTMLETARTLRRITHPALLHLAVPEAEREGVWSLTLDAAKDAGAILWSDDLGLRNAAHQIGVKAFGTTSLLVLAREHERIDQAESDRITRTLIREYTVDLPFDLAALEAVAACDGWAPGPIATVLTRPAAWRDIAAAETLVHHALAHAHDEHLAQWAYAAMVGLRAQSPGQHRDENTTALIARVLCTTWSRPEHAEALAGAVTSLAPDEATSIMQASLANTWSQLRRAHGQNQAAYVLRHLISRLGQDLRSYSAELIAGSASQTHA